MFNLLKPTNLSSCLTNHAQLPGALSRAPHAHGQKTKLCAGLYGGQQQKTAMVPSAWNIMGIYHNMGYNWI